jgi:hypothetical protein
VKSLSVSVGWRRFDFAKSVGAGLCGCQIYCEIITDTWPASVLRSHRSLDYELCLAQMCITNDGSTDTVASTTSGNSVVT